MAIVSKPYCRISAHGSVVLEVFMEYDDTDYQEINSDGDPDDFRVVRWYGTNYSASDKTITMKRANGSAIVTRTLPAGATFEQSAGGAVKYESDVPIWAFD